jgi:hypothetical protein
MYGIAMVLTLTAPLSPTPAVSHAADGSSMIVLVQSGTGAGPGTGTGLDTGKSGTGKETDAGRGTLGKKSPFGEDQPRSGDFSPNSPSSTSTPPSPADTVDKNAGSNFPAGIGEKGSDQTRSTTERSGGPQPGASESMSKSAREHGQGKTERAAKDLQYESEKEPGGDAHHPQHRSMSPSHLGPQGGSTADSGKAKHDQAAQDEQEAAKSTTPR